MISSIKRILKLKEQEKKMLMIEMSNINTIQSCIVKKIDDIDKKISSEITKSHSNYINDFEMFLKNSYIDKEKSIEIKLKYDEEIDNLKRKIKEKTFDYKKFEKLLTQKEKLKDKEFILKEQQKMDFWFSNSH